MCMRFRVRGLRFGVFGIRVWGLWGSGVQGVGLGACRVWGFGGCRYPCLASRAQGPATLSPKT